MRIQFKTKRISFGEQIRGKIAKVGYSKAIDIEAIISGILPFGDYFTPVYGALQNLNYKVTAGGIDSQLANQGRADLFRLTHEA